MPNKTGKDISKNMNVLSVHQIDCEKSDLKQYSHSTATCTVESNNSAPSVICIYVCVCTVNQWT